jgi:hypothetical protein
MRKARPAAVIETAADCRGYSCDSPLAPDAVWLGIDFVSLEHADRHREKSPSAEQTGSRLRFAVRYATMNIVLRVRQARFAA